MSKSDPHLPDFAAEDDELSLQFGQTVTVVSQADPDWWYGVLPSGAAGYFPASHVHPLT